MKPETSHIVNLPVSGSNGPAAEKELAARLTAVHGLADVEVNLKSNRVRFRLVDPIESNGTMEKVLNEVKKAGLTIPRRREEVDIFNLRCAACVAILEKGLKKKPGIADARINFATQTGQIDLIEGLYDRSRLIDDIKRIGYDADFHLDDRVETAKTSRLKRDLIVSILCTAVIFSLHFGQHVAGFFTIRPLPSAIIQLFFTLPVLYAGRIFFVDAWTQFRHMRANMNTLIAIGSGTALVYSLVVTLGLFAGGSGEHVSVYYETTAMILTFILLGRFLEERATREAREAATGMSSLIPQKVSRLTTDGREETIAVDQLNISDLVVVRPGGSVPADGVVIEGETTVDESMITGESMPVVKAVGDMITGGTVVTGNGFTMRVTRSGSGTVLARMIRMVREAQSEKAPIQRLADRVAAVFVPIVILVAVITLIIWVLISPGSKMILMAPVAVLLVACPCAMGLATPTAVLVGTGRAARLGVLFRNGNVLERLSHVDTFVFDKTGTLTDGKPVIDRMIPSDSATEETLLQFAASAEQYSEHPLGLAIRERATREGIRILKADSHENFPGQGVRALIRGRRVLVGNRSFLGADGLAPEHLKSMKRVERNETTAIIHLMVDGGYMGAITFSDTIKNGAAETIKVLAEKGFETIMLTGDTNHSAAAAAARLGIKSFEGEALPEDKLLTIRSLRQTGRVTAMVGDGVNDAAALAAADIGISLGTGTDIAIKSSDITITGKSLAAVLTALGISRATLKIIKQNLFWAFFYNIIMIPAAAGMLYPILGVTFSPVLAAAAMAMSSVFVVANSLRLKNGNPAHTDLSQS